MLRMSDWYACVLAGAMMACGGGADGASDTGDESSAGDENTTTTSVEVESDGNDDSPEAMPMGAEYGGSYTIVMRITNDQPRVIHLEHEAADGSDAITRVDTSDQPCRFVTDGSVPAPSGERSLLALRCIQRGVSSAVLYQVVAGPGDVRVMKAEQPMQAAQAGPEPSGPPGAWSEAAAINIPADVGLNVMHAYGDGEPQG